MIGKLDPKFPEVTIVGAGISGLLSAYYLDKKGWKVHLIEASSRTGGLLSTEHSPLGIAEAAAHSIPASPAVKKHFEELGIKLFPLRREARAKYILKNGEPKRMPLSITEIFKTFLSAYFRLAPKKDPESLTLAEWAKHFLGEAAYRYLITPFTRGIFGSEPDEINVSAAFPRLCVPHGHSLISFMIAKKIRRQPPVAVKRALPEIGRGPISAPENGMGEWVQTLTNHLETRLGERFVRGRTVQSLSEFSQAKNLVLTVPAHEAARLFREKDPALSESFSQVQYAPLITATVFVDRSDLESIPRGLGVLMPSVETSQCLGILYNSSAFEKRTNNAEIVSFTVMLGGSSHAGILDWPEEKVHSLITTELNRLYGLKKMPREIHLKRWKNAVPRYDHALLETWKAVSQTWAATEGHVLFGNYTGQVSLRGMLELASRL